LNQTENIHVYLVNEIKVDMINYHYPWLEGNFIIDGIRLADNKDIAAMKLAAITGRGTKKDFIDLYYLLKQFTLKEMLSFYESKYTDGSAFLVMKSLTYFEDADREQSPVMLQLLNWAEVKTTIISEVHQLIG
jgi:hypothetical protein